MTAPRSFREAFTEDPADVKDRSRIVEERDSARDWAVVLENRIEKALALHKPGPMLDHYEYGCVCGYTEHRWSECEGCGYVLDDEGELDREIHGRVCPSVAALTGGGDE